MPLDPNVHQRLLELIYDLLPGDEAAELRQQIEADAELARAYAEAQATAGLMAEAALVRGPKIPLAHPAPPAEGAVPASALSPSPRTSSRSPRRKAMSTAESSSPLKSGNGTANPLARGANWTVALAAAVLIGIALFGYFYHRQQLSEIAAEHLRLIVTGPAELQAGAPADYSVTTTTVTGEPVPSQIELAFYSPEGKLLAPPHKESTDQKGRYRITVPAGMVLPPQVELKVAATHGTKREEVETSVTVHPSRDLTQLALDKPLYQPGETVFYRSLTLSRFGLASDRPLLVHFEVLDPAGAIVPGSQRQGLTDHGVGCGEFQIPEELPGGQYMVVARSPEGAFPPEKRPLVIRRYQLPRLKKELEFVRDSYAPGDTVAADFRAERTEGGGGSPLQLRVIATVDGQTVFQKDTQADAAGRLRVEFSLPKKIERGDGQLAVVVDDGGARETMAKTIPINLGKVEVTFYPEGGVLAAGLENRVYFHARNLQGKPVHIKGMILDARDQELAPVETIHEGRGWFVLTPGAKQVYRLKISSPPGVADQPKLPLAAAETKVVLNTGTGVFDAGAPLEFTLRAAKPKMPLVVAAWCRGAPVGQQTLETKASENENKEGVANPVVVPLDEQVGGVIRLTVYDYSVHPPKPIVERLVYRRPSRKLEVRAEHGGRYSPGEKVGVSLQVTDEKGQHVPAALGVSVVDAGLLNLADDRTPGMITHFLLTSEIEKPEDLERADFYLSNEKDAAAGLDLLLGTQGWRRLVEKSVQDLKKEGRSDDEIARLAALGGTVRPPAMFDNVQDLCAKYEKSLSDYRDQRDRRTQVVNTLITISFFGGLGLMLLVALFGVLRVVAGVQLWIPAVGATICCLIVGAILVDPSRRRSGSEVAVAFTPYQAPRLEAKASEGSKPGDKDKDREKTELGKALDEVQKQEGKREELLVLGDGKEDKQVGKDPAAHLRRARNQEQARKADAFRGLQVGAEKQLRADKLFEDNIGVQAGEKRLAIAPGEVAPLPATFTVREFAHQHVSGPPGVRSDFAETLYWHPRLITDADGKAQIRFDLSDSVTTFRVQADAHGGGRIGTGRSEITARIPFNLEPRLPLEVNAGDRIDLPVAVANDTQQSLPVELALECGKLLKLDGSPRRALSLAAAARAREYFALSVVGEKGDGELVLRGVAGPLADAVKRPLRIVPPGFPKRLSYSGQIDGPQEIAVDLPEQWVPGSLEVTLNAFPSTLADLQKGLDGILQEPYGCFEQASTANYPNVLTLQYMQEHDVADPTLTRRAKELLKKGYARLAGYECKQQGYEWFGSDPGHEALTAYGLMEFRDMAAVYEIDAGMVRRTAEWLLARRDGKGGFQRNAKALDSFGAAPPAITDAYITWALSESGQKGIEAEVRNAAQLGAKSDDPYLLALAAAAVVNAGNQEDGRKLLDKLAKSQAADGHLEGKQGSITRSGGQSLRVETTALAAMAWLKLPGYTTQAQRAIEWIVKSRQGPGGFGSTQATIMALKALVQHAKTSRKTVAEGKLVLQRDGRMIGERAFGPGQSEAISLGGLEAKLSPGANRLTVTLTGNNKMPYALDVSFRTRRPDSDKNCALRLATRLARPQVKAGETVELSAEVTNSSPEGQPMTVAVLGLPAGLEARPDQLEELKKAGKFDYYETAAREIVCYWRSLAPKRKIELKLDLVAAVPGKYTGPASRAYLYYTSEQKQWTEPLAVEITKE